MGELPALGRIKWKASASGVLGQAMTDAMELACFEPGNPKHFEQIDGMPGRKTLGCNKFITCSLLDFVL